MHILSTCIFNPGVGPWTDQGNMLRIQGDRLYCLPVGGGGDDSQQIFKFKGKGSGFWIPGT